MVEKHKYIHLEFLKSATITKSVEKISYKEKKKLEETYIAAMPRSIFNKKVADSGKGVAHFQNLWESDEDIVKIELACIKHPWMEENINHFNSNVLSKQRKYE